MKLDQLKEMSYEGNIGMMEMMKFYSVATLEEKMLLKQLLASGDQDGAWELLQRVTGVKLR